MQLKGVEIFKQVRFPLTTDYYWSRLSTNATKKIGGDPDKSEVRISTVQISIGQDQICSDQSQTEFSENIFLFVGKL